MKARQIRWLLAAVLVVPGLAACEEDQLNAAAIVDDTKITVTEIQGALEKVRLAQERLGVPVEQLPTAARDEVHRRIIHLIYEKAAADMGLTITEGELAVQESELRARAGGDEAFERTQVSYGRTLEIAEQETRLTLIEIKMAEKLSEGKELTNEQLRALIGERLSAAAQSMKIRVNPRYGTFEPRKGQILPYRYDYFAYDEA